MSSSSHSSSSPPPFEQLSAESRSLFSDHYHLGRLFLGLRSAAWSALHLDAQGSVDFYRERNRANQWRLAVASVSSGAKAQVVDALGPLQLELQGKVGATSMSRSYPDGQPVISSALRLTTSGDWYRLEGRYEGLNQRRISGSAVLARRNVFQTGDRLLVGASVEDFFRTSSSGEHQQKSRWTAKWTSAPESPSSYLNGVRGTSVTTLMATLKDTSRISPPSPSSNYCLSPGQHYYSHRSQEEKSDLQCTVGIYIEELPKASKIFKYCRRTISRQWPWSDPVTKWRKSSLEKYKEVNSGGWEVKFGKGGWPIVSCGASQLTWERDEGRQLKMKVNSRGELAAAIVSYRTDLTAAAFAPTTIFSLSGMVDVWRRRASIGFGLEFTE